MSVETKVLINAKVADCGNESRTSVIMCQPLHPRGSLSASGCGHVESEHQTLRKSRWSGVWFYCRCLYYSAMQYAMTSTTCVLQCSAVTLQYTLHDRVNTLLLPTAQTALNKGVTVAPVFLSMVDNIIIYHPPCRVSVFNQTKNYGHWEPYENEKPYFSRRPQ